MLQVALIPRGVINHGEDKPSCIQSERYPIRGGLAEKQRLVLYLKVFKNHLYYLWHVRVLSIKPCLHTQLPEHNKSYWKVSREWGHLITWNGPMMGHLNSFSASWGGNLNKNFPKIQMPGGLPGGGCWSFDLTGTLLALLFRVWTILKYTKQKCSVKNVSLQEKLSFNPRLALTGFRTTRPWIIITLLAY